MLKFLLMTGGGILAFTGFVLSALHFGWLGDTQISPFGWFAFMLAAFLTIAMSTGLFALIYYSARTGRDDISDL